MVAGKSRTRKHLGTSVGLLPGDLLARFLLGTEIPGTTRRSSLPVNGAVKKTRPFVAGEPGRRRQVIVSRVKFEGALASSIEMARTGERKALLLFLSLHASSSAQLTTAPPPLPPRAFLFVSSLSL